jgi:hypothetical protein
LTRGSSRLSVGPRIGRGLTYLDGETVGGRGGEAKGPRERAAVRVRLAPRKALSARRGRQDARVREPERVATLRSEPRAVGGSSARLRAPQSAAREPRIAAIGRRDARIPDPRLAADGALRVQASRQRVEGTYPGGRLALAAGGAPCRAGAALLAPEQVLAVGALGAGLERRAATRACALRALSVVRADLADAGARPALPAAGAAAARGSDHAGPAVAFAAAEVRRVCRSDRARRDDDPEESRGDGRDQGPAHWSIEASRRPRDTAAGPDRATPRRKLRFSRGLARRSGAGRTVSGEPPAVVAFASKA